jgi:hypothetical protein
MFTKLTSLTYVAISLITIKIKIKIKGMKSLQKTVVAEEHKPLKLELDIIGSGMESLGRMKVEWIEVIVTVTS